MVAEINEKKKGKENMDPERLGFKAGLEIHQQLEGDGKKLFCNCPSVLRKEEPDYAIERKLHPVPGETGKVDVAAAYQAGLDKKFVYQGYEDSCCLLELDEEPPREINQEALKIALQVSQLLNCNIFQKTQIMRKTVIDGSNTSGFQRTVLIAYDGYIETSQGRVGIESIALEEDSARPVCRGEEKDVYKLDRLGIPLIEIATAPEAKNPEQVKEAALKIGEVLRSCKVKRGIGTIRQDVNLSISGHPRVEIKGFQEAKMFLEATENEMKRQKENLDLCKDGRKEKIKPEVRNVILEDNEEKGEKRGNTKFLRPMPGEARMYPETDLPLLKVSRGYINEIKKNLPKLRSEVEEELKNKGLSQDMIKILFKTESLEEFKSLLNVLDMPVLVGKVLLTYPKEIAGKNKVSEEEVKEKLTLDIMEFVLNAFKEEKINQDQIKQVLERIYSGEKPGEAIKFDSLDTNQIEEFIMNLIKEKPGLNANAYMGLVMKEFKGQVSGKEAMELINKHLNQ